MLKHFRTYLVPAHLVRERLSDLERRFLSLQGCVQENSQYLRFSKFQQFQKELKEIRGQVQDLRNLFLRKEIARLLNAITSYENDFVGLRERTNESFFLKEKERAKHIFTDGAGKDLLTDEQLRAVLCDDNRNLIIAGAGSGKTRVIDFKVRYLVKHRNVGPKNILLLSFSRKSASDLVKKISEVIPGIEARTIHSFSSQIAGTQEKKFFDEGHKEFEATVIKALVRMLKDSKSFRLFSEFNGKFFLSIKPAIFYRTLNELRADLRKLNAKVIHKDNFGEIKASRALKTLKGDFVRSVDERYIADFLFLQNIRYEYEREYPYVDGYYPDFYLPDYDLYYEHFAITETGGPPAYFDDPDKYMDGIKWKRSLHREKKTRMMESFSYLLNKGDSSGYLSQLFSQNEIPLQSNLDNEKAYSAISREFSRIFSKFYNSFKLSGLSLEELKRKYAEPKYSLFLQLFQNFLTHFEDLSEKENKMDFNDMILDAIKEFDHSESRSFDYVIVDEFQDTSNLAMKLLDKISHCYPDTTFLSVGDDWQSIYGFNGSDVTILSDYVKNYEGVSVQNLNSNFRSHSRIVDLGKRFVSKNPAQMKKNVVSSNRNFKASEIGFLSFERMEETIRMIPDDESIFVLYRYNDDCPALRGIFREYFFLDEKRRPVRNKTGTKNISLMTIHASKGLEARHVFLLFPDGVKKKFPSEIEDHFVFNMLRTNPDEYPFSEERRLMYVAITRAEQNLYFVSQTGDSPSIFWDELRDLVSELG